MLCLQQCIDMCDLTSDEVAALTEKASLQEVLAAQAHCPRRPAADTGNDNANCTECDLLHKVRCMRHRDGR
jgi:hypothetical protein